MLTRGLSIIRWNNFPRVVDLKQMDNVGATLHTALFLAYQQKQSTWEHIDRLYMIKKIIFISFSDLILSDINSGTKWYIKKIDEKIFDTLYSKAYEYFLSWEAPEYLKQDMRDTLWATDKVLEDQIIAAAKKYLWFVEASNNARVFPEIYEVPLGEIKKELNILSERLISLQELLSNKNHEKYLAHIYRLSFSMRWNQYQRNTPISVMSHKVIVTYISYVIGMIGNNAGEINDIEDMLMRAIYHDVPEVITWDIITPTKKAVPWFVDLLEKVEETMMDDYLFWYISPEYKQFLVPYILRPFDDDLGKKVKYADIFSALIEAKIEDRSGNQSFHEMYQNILAHISRISHPGAEFLLYWTEKENYFDAETALYANSTFYNICDDILRILCLSEY